MKTLPGITGLEYCTKGIGVQTRDPIIQSPGYSQSCNGYSYCFNNPLKYIDPSGYKAAVANDDPDDIWAAYIKALIMGYTGDYGSFSFQYMISYFNYLSSGGGGGVSGSGGFTIKWETKYLFTNGSKQIIRDNEGNIVEIRLPEIGIGYSRGSIIVGLNNHYNYGAAGGGANAWDYISNGASVASVYPTISGTWAYNNSGGDIRWTGKNGNYYKLSQVKNNGGYVKSMNYASKTSRLTRGIGNGLTYISIGATTVSTINDVANGTDNTSTWTNAAIGIGGGVLTIVGAPVVVTGAAIVGVVWGVGQLFYGDEINGWIDNNFGYR